MPEDYTNCGRIFEKKIYNELTKLKGIDRIYDENDLRKRYGWDSIGVDFLLVRKNYCIAIQTKYCKTRRREDDAIRKFINSLDYVIYHTNLKCICGFWISRMKPFDDNLSYMNSKNIQCIHEFHDMETLIHNSIKEDIKSVN